LNEDKQPTDWNLIQLSEIGKIVGGGTPDSGKKEYWEGGILWAVPTDITKLGSNFIDNTHRTISTLGLEKSSAQILPTGTILLTSRATIGECAINTKPITTNQGFQNLICNKNNNNLYILYALKYFKNKLLKMSQGTTFLEISKKNIEKIEILLPPLKEQQKIASILSNVDSLIEQTQKEITEIKNLKKGLMQKLLTKGISHKKFKIINWLFGKEIKIPEEWELKSINELGNIVTGNTPNTSNNEYFGDDYLWASPSDFGKEKYVKQTNSMLSKKGFAISRKIPKDAIMVVCIGSTIGKIGMAVKEMTTNQQINSIICSNFDSDFIYYKLQYNSYLIQNVSTQFAVPILNKTDFGKIKLTIPTNILEQQKIASILSHIDSQIESQIQYKEKLANLKKSLMQKLLTGQKRVSLP
jgi:type I restriction enzyme S subunit